jgi:transposase
MNDQQLYTQLLGLSHPWRVEEVSLDVEQETVCVHVSLESGSVLSCPQCGRVCAGYDAREERRWRHLDSCGFLTYLVARLPRVSCPDHGVQSVPVPWSEPHSRFTLAFSWFAIRVLQATKVQSQAAALLRRNAGQVHTLMHNAVRRGLVRREDLPLPHLGLDEKSFARGHSYLSVLSDTTRGRVLEVEESRTTQAATHLLQSLPQEQQETVECVSMDMWKPFLASREAVLPHADTVHDRFHIASYLGEAVDKTRRSEHRALSRSKPSKDEATKDEATKDEATKDEATKDASILNKTKYLWLKNPEDFTPQQQQKWEALLGADLETARVWAFKENFRHFFSCASVEAGQTFFDNWYQEALKLDNPHLTKVAHMLQNHLTGLLAYLQHHTTNAAAEGINSQIQLLKASARGYRRFENFRVAILFFLGKLDMNPQEIS